MTSRTYFPGYGGVPVYTRLLGRAFQDLGHEVRLFTSTPAAGYDDTKEHFKVIRDDKTWSCLKLARWCDVLLQVELSLGLIWPFLLLNRPCFISHHTHFTGSQGTDLIRRLHGWLASKCHPISVSEVLRAGWGGHGIVISNPYDDRLFHDSSQTRDIDLLFVGRLIPDKGCDVLLKALVRLGEWQMFPKLTVIGDNLKNTVSELPKWRHQAEKMGLDNQVRFLGERPAPEVAAAMRASRILVIPSTWQEPFGIVGLEGLASGCQVIASIHGGLKEACGEFATYFENGNDESLATALKSCLNQAHTPQSPGLTDHLRAHESKAIAERYIKHFMNVRHANFTSYNEKDYSSTL